MAPHLPAPEVLRINAPVLPASLHLRPLFLYQLLHPLEFLFGDDGLVPPFHGYHTNAYGFNLRKTNDIQVRDCHPHHLRRRKGDALHELHFPFTGDSLQDMPHRHKAENDHLLKNALSHLAGELLLHLDATPLTFLPHKKRKPKGSLKKCVKKTPAVMASAYIKNIQFSSAVTSSLQL